jgi:membrane protease YdiL (CAAX protease family)
VLGAFLLVVVGCGRLRFAELGWTKRALARGTFLWLASWILLNAVLLAWNAARGVELEAHAMWSRFGVGAVLGGVLAQAAGHALAEDTAFRAFVLPELRARAGGCGPFAAALVALLGSSALFGLAHLATRLLVKSPGGLALLSEQGHFFSAGLALGVVWLATQNLGAVVALHVLLNDPAPLVAVDGSTLNRAVLLVIGLQVALGAARRWRAARSARASATEVELKRAA